MTDLSKLQFVAMTLLHQADLFTKEDWAHLDHISCSIGPTVGDDEPGLATRIRVYFKDWCTESGKTKRRAKPVDVYVLFLQNGEILNGDVQVGFRGSLPMLSRYVSYIVDW